MLQYRPSVDMDGSYGVYRAMGAMPGPGSAMDKLNGLLKLVYTRADVFNIARTFNLPIIDLPRTFDPKDASLYQSQIEPSDKVEGTSLCFVFVRFSRTDTYAAHVPDLCALAYVQGGALIASLIHHIVRVHDFSASVLYSKPPGSADVVEQANVEGLEWSVLVKE